MTKSFQCRNKGKLMTIFLTLLSSGIFCTWLSYQLLLMGFWSGKINRLMTDNPIACNIPVIDPHASAEILMELHGRYVGAPQCIGTEIKFKIEYQNYSIVRINTESDYWNEVDCCYTVCRIGTHRAVINGTECFPIHHEYTTIPYDHQNLDIKCNDKRTGKIIYRDQFPIFRTDPTIEARIDAIPSNVAKDKPLSILILGLDSVSHQNFIRYMPKSYDFLRNKLDAVEFFGFNKVGQGTIANIIAMLTGCKVETPLHHPYVVDKHCQLIWDKYNDQGFRTIHLEDAFFNEQKIYSSIRKHSGIGTHYSLSNFMDVVKWILEEENGKDFFDEKGCFGNQFLMDTFAQVIVEVAKKFAGKPYFNFGWYSVTSHSAMSNSKFLDEPIYRTLTELRELNLLDETIVVVIGDHGPWHVSYLDSDSAGALEKLMPVLLIGFPESFKSKYSEAYNNLKSNAKRLTTQYDIFETLLDLSNLTTLSNEVVSLRNASERPHQLGQSLFLPVPLNRTCETANIPPEYCMCFSRSSISSPETNEQVQKAVAFAVTHLNFEISRFPLCAPLKLKSIEMATWLGSRGDSGGYILKNELLQVTFTTTPADAEFTATVGIDPSLNIVGEVIRNDMYKRQSYCISSWANATYAKTMCSCTTTKESLP